MFTGIIQTTGIVRKIEEKEKLLLVLEVGDFLAQAKIGDSVAVSGVCLTMIEKGENFLTFEIMPETARVTILGALKVGDKVNLEPPLKLSDSLNGHLVLGHVDGVGEITKIKKDGNDVLMTIKPPQEIIKFIPYKGTVAINGVSLTIARDEGDEFSVALISHTLKVTNLSDLGVGDKVNLEIDMIARYLEKIISSSQKSSS